MYGHNYFVYFLSSLDKSAIYLGVTSDLQNRVYEHKTGKYKSSFTSKYNCSQLIYFEHFTQIDHAIDREKQLKKWSRKKKELLIKKKNPHWISLNKELFEGDLV